MVTFGYTIFYVQDVAATVDFYERAFGLSRKFIAPDASYGELATGATTLAFATIDLAASNFEDGFIESNSSGQPFGMEIGFTTDNVAATLQSAIAAGAILAAAPKTKPWGQVVAYVRDVNGFLVEICTPVAG